MSRGRLIVAGTGIKAVGHVTLETRTLIERAARCSTWSPTRPRAHGSAS